jgi:hypothetical protein
VHEGSYGKSSPQTRELPKWIYNANTLLEGSRTINLGDLWQQSESRIKERRVMDIVMNQGNSLGRLGPLKSHVPEAERKTMDELISSMRMSTLREGAVKSREE